MSDQETTENFWRVWTTFKWPEPLPISYRCYYDKDGAPTLYTMEDLPGDYIEVSKEVYLLSPFTARVVDQKLVIFKPKNTIKKLRPDDCDGIPCHPNDVCVITNMEDEHVLWSAKQYEIC